MEEEGGGRRRQQQQLEDDYIIIIFILQNYHLFFKTTIYIHGNIIKTTIYSRFFTYLLSFIFLFILLIEYLSSICETL